VEGVRSAGDLGGLVALPRSPLGERLLLHTSLTCEAFISNSPIPTGFYTSPVGASGQRL
jgi:hypothetical protein